VKINQLVYCLVPVFDLEDRGAMFFRNVCWLSQNYMPLYSRRNNFLYACSSICIPWHTAVIAVTNSHFEELLEHLCVCFFIGIGFKPVIIGNRIVGRWSEPRVRTRAVVPRRTIFAYPDFRSYTVVIQTGQVRCAPTCPARRRS
jgi:hypothetical protein